MESVVPSIAQLVERRTVEFAMISLGRWFESGSKEVFSNTIFFFTFFTIILVINKKT